MRLELIGLPLTVYNVYKALGGQLEAEEMLPLVGGGRGDFNAHHSVLQSVSPTSLAGRRWRR